MDQAAILARLEELLVERIPKCVAALGMREPVYSLRVWYFGSDLAGDRTPTLMITTDALRQKVIAAREELAPNYLWGADELDRIEGVYYAKLSAPDVSALCHAWYKGYESSSELPPAPQALQPFRQMVQRVAKRLNDFEWPTCLCPTSDFVVFAADGSHDFCNDFEEMTASVSAKQLDSLRSRHLLGTSEWWKLDAP